MKHRGTIERIVLKKFGTFNSVEISPQDNLNVIIGPNGTGKSTIISAIILGLNGSTKLIGRASNISDYIKSNCTEAEISIELNTGDELPNPVISRVFNTNNQSKWSLNDKKVSPQQIKDLISEYNIQVDNLCQFLPQDRVQDFSKMNSIELLMNTQRAICSSDEISTYETLLQVRQSHLEKEKRIAFLTSRINDMIDANDKISNAVGIFEEMEQLKQKLGHVKAKLLWSQYDMKQKEVVGLKEQRTQLSKLVDEGKKLQAEINTKITSITAKLQKLQTKEITEETRLNSLLKDIVDQQNEIDREMMNINTVVDETNKKVEEEENRANKVLIAKAYSDKLKTDFDLLVKDHGDENQINQKRNELLVKIKEVDVQHQLLKKKNYEVSNSYNNIKRDLETNLREKQALGNMKQARLDLLARVDKDAYTATMWLRNNKEKFRKKIYDPILVEVNFTSENYAPYVENVIPARDRCLFICEDVNDMNLFLSETRVKQKLNVSAAHSGSNIKPFHMFKPSHTIDSLKQFGFVAFLSEIIKAPEPIMKYLCQLCGIYNIPIATTEVGRYVEDIPSEIHQFYSGFLRYSSKISKYSKNKVSMVTEINSKARLFSMSYDEAKMKNLNEQIDQQMSEIKIIKSQVQKIEQQITNNRATRETFLMHSQELVNVKQKLNTAQFRYERSLKEVDEIERNCVDIDEELRKREACIVSIVSTMERLIDKKINLMKKYKVHHDNFMLLKLEVNAMKKKLKDVHDMERNYESANLENIDRLNGISASYKQERDIALKLYAEAKQLTNNTTPNCEGFEQFNHIFDNLPEQIESLESMAKELEARVSATDESVVRQFQSRRKDIETLQREKDQCAIDTLALLTQLKTLQDKWLTPFTEIVAKINENVERYFKYMGFTGRVVIKHGENELDFDRYGLAIEVSFRVGEPLQELNRHVQSGGERAVATAVYMLSLQHLSRVPFRCVDEINQGMDSVNERKVFEMITKITAESGSSQYFYLTPKLLSGLSYKRNTTIHCIHNGPYECERPGFNSSPVVNSIKRQSLDISDTSF